MKNPDASIINTYWRKRHRQEDCGWEEFRHVLAVNDGLVLFRDHQSGRRHEVTAAHWKSWAKTAERGALEWTFVPTETP